MVRTPYISLSGPTAHSIISQMENNLSKPPCDAHAISAFDEKLLMWTELRWLAVVGHWWLILLNKKGTLMPSMHNCKPQSGYVSYLPSTKWKPQCRHFISWRICSLKSLPAYDCTNMMLTKARARSARNWSQSSQLCAVHLTGGPIGHFRVYGSFHPHVCAGGRRGWGGREGGYAVLIAVESCLQLKLDGMDAEMQPWLQCITLVVLPATHIIFTEVSNNCNSALYFASKGKKVKW